MKDKIMWAKTETSTRNCYNAVLRKGIVSCRMGGDLFDGKNRGLSGERVASRGVFFACCRRCSSFDNDWD